MQRQELEAMTRDELRAVAKDKELKGRGTMTKAELIDALASAEDAVEDDETHSEEVVEVDSNVASIEMNVTADEAVVSQIADEEMRKVRHMQAVENAEVGVIVAFMFDGRCRSAKIIKKSTKNKMMLLQTNYGAEFKVPFDSIVWVKNGKRWPRGVYNMLKGIENGSEEDAGADA